MKLHVKVQCAPTISTADYNVCWEDISGLSTAWKVHLENGIDLVHMWQVAQNLLHVSSMADAFLGATSPVEGMVLQHEERLQELEKGKPIHESLANFQDVFKLLTQNVHHLSQHMKDAEDFVAMYLAIFEKLPKRVRVDQCWQIVSLCNERQWKMLTRTLFQSIRVMGGKELLMFWKSQAPYESTCESNSGPEVLQSLMAHMQ